MEYGSSENLQRPESLFRFRNLHSTVELSTDQSDQTTVFFLNLKQELDQDINRARNRYNRSQGNEFAARVRRMIPIPIKNPEMDVDIKKKTDRAKKCIESIEALKVGSVFKPETLLLEYLNDQYQDLLLANDNREIMGSFKVTPISRARGAIDTLSILDPLRAENIRELFLANTPRNLKNLLSPKNTK